MSPLSCLLNPAQAPRTARRSGSHSAPTLASSRSAQTTRVTQLPSGSWWTLEREWLTWTDVNTCNDSTPPPPARLHPFRDGNSRVGSLSPLPLTHGVQLHGRMPLCVTITPPAAPASLSRPYNSMVRSRVSTFAAMLGDSMPRYQVTCNSPPTPSHHASPLVSALPPRCVRKRSSATVHRHVLPPSQRASARTTSMLHVAVAPAPSCRVTARRTGRCGRGVYRAARGR
jgi:hypothetical protein